MTLDELLECSVSELEKMTDEQLLAIFKPYFPTTRPDMVVKKVSHTAKVEEIYVSPQKKAALLALEESGIDISFMKRKMKK